MRKYVAPEREFFRLPNNIFAVPMSPYEFQLYTYLVCCCGSRGYYRPIHKQPPDYNHSLTVVKSLILKSEYPGMHGSMTSPALDFLLE